MYGHQFDIEQLVLVMKSWTSLHEPEG